MSTAVVVRPHSPLTDTRSTDTRSTDSRATDSRATSSPGPSTWVSSTQVVGTARRTASAPLRGGAAHAVRPADPTSGSARSTAPVPLRRAESSNRPACASATEVFLDPALESEPLTSAPARDRRRYTALAAEATEICAACPLLSACLYRAVVEYDVAGFVAGTTERQRGRIRARLGVEVAPEDFDSLAGVVGGQRTVDHDEVVRLRRMHPDESLERIARRLGCSLSTVKRHLRQERNQPRSAPVPAKPRPTEAQVRRATAETLAENSGNRRAAA